MMDLDFQERVRHWVTTVFGEKVLRDLPDRNHRFLEEALELVQAGGCTKEEVLLLVDYVFDRPTGVPKQEVGGVMITLAALCDTHRLNMEQCGEVELHRVWGKVEEIRAKHLSKPKNSPLPGHRGAQ
ncbi:hypothetical protein [uncultured Tateyamaria sp.]|uniref:hypothetical protein n=1 Tax=uncultured Tateyamaria sp. TaxID=455651 RepID=UPI0026131A16|nr:hypothetical protein [uncultured Tateyamaria sp.]